MLIYNKSKSFLFIFAKSHKKEVAVHLDFIDRIFLTQNHPFHTIKKHLFDTLFHIMKGRGIFFQLSVYSKVKDGMLCELFFVLYLTKRASLIDVLAYCTVCLLFVFLRTSRCLDTQKSTNEKFLFVYNEISSKNPSGAYPSMQRVKGGVSITHPSVNTWRRNCQTKKLNVMKSNYI